MGFYDYQDYLPPARFVSTAWGNNIYDFNPLSNFQSEPCSHKGSYPYFAARASLRLLKSLMLTISRALFSLIMFWILPW